MCVHAMYMVSCSYLHNGVQLYLPVWRATYVAAKRAWQAADYIYMRMFSSGLFKPDLTFILHECS